PGQEVAAGGAPAVGLAPAADEAMAGSARRLVEVAPTSGAPLASTVDAGLGCAAGLPAGALLAAPLLTGGAARELEPLLTRGAGGPSAGLAAHDVRGRHEMACVVHREVRGGPAAVVGLGQA